MDITQAFVDIMGVIAPILTLSGMLSLAISLIVMLVNMIVGAATGKGFSIGLK